MTLVLVAGRLATSIVSHLEVGDALIDEADVALGAGDGDLLLVVEDVGGVAGADDRRQAELAADDRGMRGAPAVVGDDRRRRAS